MTKLTTERLEEIAKLEITEFSNGMDIAKDAYQSVGSSEIVLMARQLLAYEQAAEHPAARITWDGSEFSVSNVSEDFLYGGTAVYLAPVLPKQPEHSRQHFESLCNQFWNWAELDEIDQDEEPRLEWNGSNYTHRVTAALWKMYQAAPAQPVSEPYKLPELNDELIEILGRPNFTCTKLAECLRKCGQEIKRKSEYEQAAVLHVLLNLYIKHGNDWRKHAEEAFTPAPAQESE
ncbi:MAG: hypothetical protein L0I83_02305 [Enterobacterales bacterium]|nr:hypothetical protein [Enterobacterales bacterium]